MNIKQLEFQKDIDYVGQDIFVAKGILNNFILKKKLKDEDGLFVVWIDNFPIGQFELEEAIKKANKKNEEKYYFMVNLLKQWEIK